MPEADAIQTPNPASPTETTTPETTSTPTTLLNLQYSPQEFTSPETFQAWLGDLDIVIGRFNGGAEIWFNLIITEANP